MSVALVPTLEGGGALRVILTVQLGGLESRVLGRATETGRMGREKVCQRGCRRA